jgi:diguanylate cyclase (GGDEF)-like protein
MTLVFDVRTLFYVGSLTALACSLMLWQSRDLHAPSAAALRWAASSQLMFGAAMAGISLRGAIPDLLSYQIANTLGTAAAAVAYESVRRLVGARPLPWLTALVTAGLLAINLALGDDPARLAARLYVNATMHAIFAAAAVPLLLGRLRQGDDAPRPLRWATGFMVAFAIAHLFRMAVTATSGARVTMTGMVEGPLQMLMPSVFALAPMTYAMILIGLVNGRLSAELWRLATVDTLTGLRTRRSFIDEARRALADERRPVLLMLDLDRFKQINDRHGHASGDRVLARFARLLREVSPEAALVGRYGGEEFCLLLPDASPDDGHAHAQRLCDAVRRIDHGLSAPVTVSIGLASGSDGDTLEELLLAADRRLYRAKASGRDRVVATDGPLSPDTVPLPLPKPGTAPSGAPAGRDHSASVQTQ